MVGKTKFAVVGIIALAVTGGGVYWYEQQKINDTNAITVKFNRIQQSDYEQTPSVIYPLNIEFSGSVAPIDKVKGEINQGVKIEPAIEGKWVWKNDHLLTFTPNQDWPTGQEYKITLEKIALNPSLTYAKSVVGTHAVKTEPFRVTQSDVEFYQDPNLAHIRHSLAHFTFSNPIEPKELEKAVEVNLVRQNQDKSLDMINPLKFKINYSDNKLEAWISSDELGLSLIHI